MSRPRSYNGNCSSSFPPRQPTASRTGRRDLKWRSSARLTRSRKNVLSDPNLNDISGKVSDLRRQVADLSAIYNPEYSHAQAGAGPTGSHRIGNFESTRADILKRIENDHQEALSKEKLLASAYDAQTREVTGQDEKAIQYNILKREVDSNRQLYDTMLQQTKQSSIASALRASNVRVVDQAETPEMPISPDLRVNSAIGFFAGLFLCIAVVTVRERADRTLQQPGDIKMWTDLTELGTIPSLRSSRNKIYGRAPVCRAGREFANGQPCSDSANA